MVIGLISIALFITIAILKQLTKPFSARASVAQIKPLSTSYQISLTPAHQTGRYVAFNYPSGLKLVSKSLISPISLEDYQYYIKDIYSWTLVVDIVKLPAANLNNSSSFSLRKNKPSIYQEGLKTIHQQTFIVFKDTAFNSGFSKVAYLAHGNDLAIVSLIGSDQSGLKPLSKTFNMVLSSLQWR